MRLSAYNLVTDAGDGEVFLTNLLSRMVLSASPQQFALFESLRGEGCLHDLSQDEQAFVAALAQGLFILPDYFDEMSYVHEMHRKARASRGVKNLVIAPTMRCNMSCHYCFENRTGSSMCAKVQDTLVESVALSLGEYESLHVQWFGGEPLLDVEFIESLSYRLKAAASGHGKTYSAEVITNGYMLTESIACRLAAVDVREAQVTLEGMRRFHDKIRFIEGHKGSFDRIIKNIAGASAHLKVNVRVHVAPYNLESVRELIDFLGESIPRRISRLYFSPLFNYQSEGKLAQYLVDRRRFLGSRDFAVAQVELVQLANSHGISTGDPLNASYGLCLAMLEGTEVIGPSGAVTKCYLDINVEQKAHANLRTGHMEPARDAIWHDYDFAADNECRSCTFLPVCLGGCPSQRLHRANKEVVCTPLKFNFHERIRLAYSDERSGSFPIL